MCFWGSSGNCRGCQWHIAEKDMDKMIREMYRNMLREQEGTDKISKGTEEEIRNLLSSEGEGRGQEEYARCRDFAFYIASAAEENGFVQGFRYAFRLFAECMQE